MATKFFPLFFVFLTVHGFLLDKSQSANGQLGTSNQYVTALEFLDETKSRHQEDEQIRHYVDKSLAVLSSQLEHKFHILEQQLIKCENQTDSTPSNESLEQKYLELENKLNQLQTVNKVLQTEQNLMKNELWLLRNKTGEVNNDVKMLKQLGNIKPLQEIQTLQQAIQTVSAQTHSLSVNERARSQDFLALYNMTIDSKRVLTDLNTYTRNQITQMETNTKRQLMILQQNQNSTAAEMISKILAIEKYGNMSSIHREIDKIEEIVLLSSKGDDNNPALSSGAVVRFPNVDRFQGINSINLNKFKSDGKYVCEAKGLYLVAANVITNIESGWFMIMKNNKELTRTYIAEHGGKASGWHSSTGITYAMLNPADTVHVAAGNPLSVSGIDCTLTIIKIK